MTANSRLTKAAKEHICLKLMKHKYKDVKHPMDIRREKIHNLALTIIDDVMNKESKSYGIDATKMLDFIPSTWLCKENGIKVVFGSYQTYLSLNQYIKMPLFLTRERVQYDATHAFSEEYNEIEEEFSRADEERISCRKDIMSTLDSFTTASALLKSWPEIKPFLSEQVSIAKLPTIRVEVLNDMLGLPVEGEAA